MRRRILLPAGLISFFFVTAVAQGFQINWVCDPKEHRLYRRDLGVVCWDGRTYRKDDPGGIPQYMIDYFDQMRRNLQQKVGPANTRPTASSPTRTASPASVVFSERASVPIAKAPQVAQKAISPEDFASIANGMKRADVIQKLGNPAGSISIPDDEGFTEILTYALTDASTAKVRIEAGAVVSHQVEKPSHGG